MQSKIAPARERTRALQLKTTARNVHGTGRSSNLPVIFTTPQIKHYEVRKIKEEQKYKDGSRIQKAALSLSSDLCQETLGLGQDEPERTGGVKLLPTFK
ncbi:jg1744 [Pararge aegeria aegeria]|uniref:Jg1744 protein n=1 Tax=Pararge aegeria aegeria TaxID=348720 RepID=A0A8S4SL55_9NEOP|nr:jg1744 [Pararge aegeria aegeria]